MLLILLFLVIASPLVLTVGAIIADTINDAKFYKAIEKEEL